MAATVVRATMPRRMPKVMTRTWKSITRASSPAHRARERQSPGLVRVVVDRSVDLEAQRERAQHGAVQIGRARVRRHVLEVGGGQERELVPCAVVERGFLRI